MEEPTELTSEELEELQEDMEDDAEDKQEDSMEMSQEMQEAYGSPMPEERHNQWTILNRALGEEDTVRTTFLTENELGRPLFSVRFMLDMADLAGFYNAPRVQRYFNDKIQNITGSGMSNKGFTMHLNVTQRREATKRRIREKEVKNARKS